jgi:RNA polymerase sigma factor (sigma-70 family)
LALKILRRQFKGVIDEDGLESVVIRTLGFCFKHFDPAKGDPTKPVTGRFLNHFAYWLKRRLEDVRRDNQRRLRRYRKEGTAFKEAADLRPVRVPKDGAYDQWSRRLCQEAMSRMDEATQRYIRLCFIEGKGAEEAGRLLGIPERTRCRKYGFDRLVAKVRGEVTRMVEEMPQPHLKGLVDRLHFEEDFSAAQIARLLCVSVPFIESVVHEATEGVMKGMRAGREGIREAS